MHEIESLTFKERDLDTPRKVFDVLSTIINSYVQNTGYLVRTRLHSGLAEELLLNLNDIVKLSTQEVSGMLIMATLFHRLEQFALTLRAANSYELLGKMGTFAQVLLTHLPYKSTGYETILRSTEPSEIFRYLSDSYLMSELEIQCLILVSADDFQQFNLWLGKVVRLFPKDRLDEYQLLNLMEGFFCNGNELATKALFKQLSVQMLKIVKENKLCNSPQSGLKLVFDWLHLFIEKYIKECMVRQLSVTCREKFAKEIVLSDLSYKKHLHEIKVSAHRIKYIDVQSLDELLQGCSPEFKVLVQPLVQTECLLSRRYTPFYKETLQKGLHFSTVGRTLAATKVESNSACLIEGFRVERAFIDGTVGPFQFKQPLLFEEHTELDLVSTSKGYVLKVNYPQPQLLQVVTPQHNKTLSFG